LYSGSLYVIADGLGTSTQGKLAGRYAAQRVTHYYYTHNEPDLGLRLRESIEAANGDLHMYGAQQPELVKVGATIVAAAIRGEELHIASVGDSRAYLIRDGEIRQITRDHTLVQQLLEEEAITPEEAADHPRRDVVLRSLGAEETVRVDVVDMRLHPDDALVLCSDGLTRYLHEDEIAAIVGSSSPQNAAETLLRKTLDRGAKENVSVVAGLMRDGAPAAPIMTEYSWDGHAASFDQQQTLMIRRSDLGLAPGADRTTLEPPSAEETVPGEVNVQQFMPPQPSVGTALPPDVPAPVQQNAAPPLIPPWEDDSLPPSASTIRAAPPFQQTQQPAPPYQQPAQPAPAYQPPPIQPDPTQAQPPPYPQQPYGQRGAPRGYPGGYTPPPGYAIDPVTGLPPVPTGVQGGYEGYPPQGGYPQGPRIYQPPAQPMYRSPRSGISLGRFIAVGIGAILLTIVMVVILVNPLNWNLPFGGGAAGAETPATEQAAAETQAAPTQPAAAAQTSEAVPTSNGLVTATPQSQAPPGMALIDGGAFLRGVGTEEAQAAILSCIRESEGGTCNAENFSDAEPVEDVTISPFFMDVTEVTNLDYASCVAAEICTPPSDQTFYADPAYGQHPVTFVNWNQAGTYCQWAGKRLPTEAEWEKAARWDEIQQKSFIYPWGDDFEAGRANTLAAGQGGTSAVQAFSQDLSPTNILDMAGNVSEWVADWYFPGYTGLGTLNPNGPAAQPLPQPQRSVRGGSYLELAAYSRGGHRLSADPVSAAAWLGFRCAQGVNGSEPAPTDEPTPTPTGEATTEGAEGSPTVAPTPQP
jgi:protein phosphatase